MCRLQNIKRKVAARTEKTLCLSTDITFETSTQITWPKSKKKYDFRFIFGPSEIKSTVKF